ncbi:hypothetical protein KH5_13090 [Urechidicola sp. KH5]
MKRIRMLSIFALLFISFIVVWNHSYNQGREEAYVPLDSQRIVPSIPSETGVFRRSGYALDYSKMPYDEDHQRTLDTYYDNRAYPGAPPYIPHEIADNLNMGGNSCLKCHENGGFSPKFGNYAPVTPHPEMINCRQCHVPQETSSLFKATNFAAFKAPSPGNNALPGSPPIVPHSLQMRENCLSCHAGPSAPIEIRVTHPERVNCRQCHVLNDKVTADIGIFKKQNHEELP